MNLTERAIQDLAQITGNSNDFGVKIVLTDTLDRSAELVGFHVKHHMNIDELGNTVNSKKASVAFSESNLPAGFSIRVEDDNSDFYGDVSLKDWLVQVADSTGNQKMYKVQQWFPDEKLGMIVLILGDYVAD